ncbi:hypothetical protein JXA56_02135 [Candidatus Micrarchaeota archaeon]|nr:hypothetical protein [Candidatus Micrarchaeota archaeon]
MEEPKKVSDAFQSVNVALDSYDDIFSDFDPSQYQTRLLSADFLNELKRRYIETPKGSVAVTFTLPGSVRSEKQEALIKKRLKDYFRGRLKHLHKAGQERLKKGLLRVALGLAVSLSLLALPPEVQTFVAALISPLLWYLMWSGFEFIFDASQKIGRQRNFMEKFLKADYHFKNEEDLLQNVLSH